MKRKGLLLYGVVIVLLLSAHLAVSFYRVVPGYISIDEGTYHFMAKSFAEGGGVSIRNGYEEFPSKEFQVRLSYSRGEQVRIHGNRLVALPPHLYAVVAWPFFKTFGYRGLFLLNSLAFVGVGILCFLIGKEISGSAVVGIHSTMVFALGTYAWEYSQASWPHMTALFFLTAAFYFFLRGWRTSNAKQATLLFLTSGLITGFSVGIRADCILLPPILFLPFLAVRRPRYGEAATFAAGTVPGLATMAWINEAKFGIFSPVAYGSTSHLARFLPIAIGGCLVLGAVFLFGRLSLASRLRTLPRSLLVLGTLGILLAVAFSPLRRPALRLARGTYELAVDMRAYTPPFNDSGKVHEPGMYRSPGGAVMYMGRVKKALLQSCPYLPYILLPLFLFREEGRLPKGLGFLFFIPLVFLSFFSFFSWHGGLCLNMRYLLPVLPFTSVLTALAWRIITKDIRRGILAVSGILAAAVTGGAYFLYFRPQAATLTGQGSVYLQVPLYLCIATTTATVVFLAFPRREIRPFRILASVLLISGLTWAGIVGIDYDYRFSTLQRTRNFYIGNTTAKLVPPESIVFTNAADPFFALLGKRDVRIARPDLDNFADFRKLVAFYLEHGRAVYAAFPPREWKKMEKRNLLDGYTVKLQLRILRYFVARIRNANR